jgi:hypothetical protein
MRWVHSTNDAIELRGRSGVGTPLLVGSLLLCWPLLAMLMAGFPSGERLVALLAVAALALGFVWLGWPKVRKVTLAPAKHSVIVNGRARSLSPDSYFRLVPAPAKPVAGPLRYGVLLEARDAAPVLVLSDDDPAQVLSDLIAIRKILPLTTYAGWGLGRDTVAWLASERAPSDDIALPSGEDDPVEPTRRRATTAISVGTAGALGLLVMEIRGRMSRGDVAIPLSLVLPALAVLILGVMVVAVRTFRPRLSIDREIACEWRLGGILLKRRGLDRSGILRADVVSPTGRSGRHLLLSTPGGYVALPCDRTEGVAAAARLMGAAR